MIEHMLEKRANLALEEIDTFVAARGPGSFTGLRIGISVIKGLAYAMGKPAYGVSSLDGIAFRFVHSSLPVCVMMDARRNEVYCAVYQFEQGCLLSKSRESVVPPNEVLDFVEQPAVFAGSGSRVYKDMILEKADHPVMADEFMNSVDAAALLRSLQMKKDYAESPENSLTPTYIRKSDAELNFTVK